MVSRLCVHECGSSNMHSASGRAQTCINPSLVPTRKAVSRSTAPRYLFVEPWPWCIRPPTLDRPLLNSWLRVLPGVWLLLLPCAGAAPFAEVLVPLPMLLRYWPVCRAVARRSAWRVADDCSRGCWEWLARSVLLVLRVLRAVRGGVGSVPSCWKYRDEGSSVARDSSDCVFI